ncbi:MAG: hypothetical protein AAGA63_11720 [Pseudomonadota bacterium]
MADVRQLHASLTFKQAFAERNFGGKQTSDEIAELNRTGSNALEQYGQPNT